MGYDPNEARDYHGRWAGGSSDGHESSVPSGSITETKQRILEHFNRTGQSPNYNTVGGYDVAKPAFDQLIADGVIRWEKRISPTGKKMKILRLTPNSSNP